MVKPGIDKLDEYLYLFDNKRVGLITNPTGLNSNFVSSIDLFNEKTNLKAMFSCEHGVRANNQAGQKFASYIDEKTNVIVHSLYGKSKKPSKEMMDEIDIVAVDILDVGSRFYTFIYTLAYMMIACKENNKPIVVFDRPNPCNASTVEGTILDMKYRSFIGYFPIVQRHGMTIGEIAKLFNEEYGINCDLTVVKMEGYKREMYYEDTGMLWVMPSPNFPTIETSLTYNSTCIFEGTNIEEGRGTTAPFQMVGAPFIDPYLYSDKLNSLNLPGVYFRPTYFRPTFSKYPNIDCAGVEVHVLDRNKYQAVKVGFAMFQLIRDLYPDKLEITAPYKEGMHTMLAYNIANSDILDNKLSLEEQFKLVDEDTEKFKKVREKYLLYKEEKNEN